MPMNISAELSQDSLLKIAGALAIYREMETSVLFATRKEELEYKKKPPLSLLVRVIPPSFQFHLFLFVFL